LDGSPAKLLQSSLYLRELLQYIYQCAMPGALDPITNTPNPTSYDTSLDPWGGTLLCTPPGSSGAGSACPDSTYTCTPQGTCVIPLNGAIGLAINADGSSWWGEAADGSFPDYTKSAVGGLAGACDESCQRWISACVLARTNAYGVHVEISMRAPANAPPAIKNALAPSPSLDGNLSEVDLFSHREGAYYGNIFETTPVPSTPPSPGYSGPATGAIAETPIYTACAGPESNVPEITKRFESSQGDQVVISVPGVCLTNGNQPGACAGSDTSDPSSQTYGSVQHCYTKTSLTSSNACATIVGPQGVHEPADPTCYDEVITVFLAQPIAVCGNGVCEPPSEDSTCCPSDCHPATWAKEFSPLLQTGTAYQAPACTAGTSCPGAPAIDFSPTAMSAVASDGSIAVVGNATVDICPNPSECPLALGPANLPATLGTGVLVKFDADGNYAWSFGGVRFGNAPPDVSVNPLQSVSGVIMGTNPYAAPTSPDYAGNITVVGATTQVGTSNQELWISSFSSDGAPLGTWIPDLVGSPTLSPLGGTLAFDSQGNLVVTVNTTDSTSSTLADFTKVVVSAGTLDSVCALTTHGTVECWGDNARGELGNGTTGTPTSLALPPLGGADVATPVPNLSGVIDLAVGSPTCALLSDGTIKCWGDNTYGELGIGTTTGPQTCAGWPCATTPVAVLGLTDATAIATGDGFACALMADGSIDCWGAAPSGTSTIPVAVSGLTGATSISAGPNSVCARLSDGTVMCWGDNSYGQLGNGSTTSTSVPVAVSGLANVTAISVGKASACAVLSSGAVECWGDNSLGQLGNGSATGPGTCAGDPCWTTPVGVAGLPGPATQVVAGGTACALLSGGAVYCWGDNSDGQLGTGTNTGPQTCGSSSACSPAPVTALTGATEISAGAELPLVCAALSGGSVECWGNYPRYATLPLPRSPTLPAPALLTKTSLPPTTSKAPVLWAAALTDVSQGAGNPQSLAMDPNDNVVVVTSGNVSRQALRKICADGTVTSGARCPDGSTAWSQDPTNPAVASGYYSAVTVDSGGNIYAGITRTRLSGAPSVQKLDVNGNTLWATTSSRSAITCGVPGATPVNCPSDPSVQPVSMGFDGGGNLVVASFGNPSIGGGINFGPAAGPATLPTYGSPNIFLSAYDTNTGAVEWAEQIQTILASSVHGMALGNQGQIIVAGNYSGSMQVDGQLLVTATPESPTVTDSFLASFAEPAPVTPTIGQGNTCGGAGFDTVPSDIYVPATSSSGACVFFMPPTSSWAASVTCTPRPNTTFPIGSTPVTCTASDAYGHSVSTPPFNVNVFNPAPPVLTNPPANITQTVPGPTVITYAPPLVIDQLDNPTSCASCAAPPTPGGPPGPPPVCNPPPVSATCIPAPGSTFPLGTTTVSCTTTDSAGRSANTSFTVTLIPQVTASCVGAPGAPVTVPTAPGTCGLQVSNASSVAGTCGGGGLGACTFSGQASETLGLGTYAIPVVATAVDLSTTQSCTSYIRVVDSQNPVVSCGNQTVECSGNNGASVTPSATCTDNCSCSASCATGFFPLGSSSGSCSASDPSGNGASCQPTITVTDTHAPSITLNSSPATLQCGVDHYTEAGAKATDTCAGDLTSAITESGAVNAGAVGSYTVTYAVADPSGNATSVPRPVKVIDTQAPATTATVGPNPTPNKYITISITSYTVTPQGGGTAVTGSAQCWTSAGLSVALQAADACALKQLTYTLTGAQTGSGTPAGGSATINVSKSGSTTVTYSATDKAGNVETTKTLPLFVGAAPGGQYGFSCAPSPSLKNLPPHGNVAAKGTVSVTDSKTGKTVTQAFSFTQSY
jgi:alpha-tubulin suppressor-like RCC1 family protein